ncbi:MAG: Cna B-type domain-containing protein, partial [Oscillospiraceae bacterium]|nr:Cna B-type domain-containing protein [Oscillospiraceae bacterium]
MKRFSKFPKIAVALLLAAVMALGLLPATSFTILAAAEFPEGTQIDESAGSQKTEDYPGPVDLPGNKPASLDDLADGQVWTFKNVKDNGDGTFEITFYAWAKGYTIDGDHYPPLGGKWKDDDDDDDEVPYVHDSFITVEDVIGEMFVVTDPDGDGTFEYKDDTGIVKWVVQQEDILYPTPASIKFTVSFNGEGAVVGETYWTNEGASATFIPVKGNPYYWTTTDARKAELEITGINWNNGTTTGFKDVTLIKDLELLVEMTTSDGANMTVRYLDKDENVITTTTFTLDTNRCSENYTASFDEDGNLILPANIYTATDGTWGSLWNKGGGSNKTYYIWFMGLTEPGVVTVYDITPGNNGGNGGEGGTRYMFYNEYHHIEGLEWVEKPPHTIKADIDNPGYIILEAIKDSLTINKKVEGKPEEFPIRDFTFEVTLTIPKDIFAEEQVADVINGLTIDGEPIAISGEPNGYTVTFQVTIEGAGSILIEGLPVGTGYTVEEIEIPKEYDIPQADREKSGNIENSKEAEEAVNINAVSFTNEFITTSVSGTKTWVDGNDAAGLRPENLVLVLKADGEVVANATPTWEKNGNTWTYTYSGLPKYSNGVEIEYTVDEVVPGDYNQTANSNGSFTNTLKPGETSIAVTKEWVDNGGIYGRPTSVTI